MDHKKKSVKVICHTALPV